MAHKSKEKQLKICSAISRVHSSIGANLKLEEISQILVEEIVSILDCAGCIILLIEGEVVRILAERGFSKMLGEGEFAAAAPMLKFVSETKQSILTGDISNSPTVGHIAVGCFIKSLICAPVVVSGQVRSIIALDSPDENAFAEEDLHFVELMAKGMSIAMERTLLHAQVEVLTINDGLTGCYNRKKLAGDLDVEIARAQRYHRPLSLSIISIDWFSKYSCFHGQTKSDELLRKIGAIITRNVRVVDKVYRYEDEKFAVLVPETDKEHVSTVADRLREVIEGEQFEGEQESQPDKKITVSIGIASYPLDGTNSGELFRSAARALSRDEQCDTKEQGVIEEAK
jgi:diguanylate cyclase (GGDEF)-like protein